MASSGDHQKLSYLDFGKGRRWDLHDNEDNVALVDLGLDYTTFNSRTTPWASMPVEEHRSGLVIVAPAGRCQGV